eukprot:420866_1
MQRKTYTPPYSKGRRQYHRTVSNTSLCRYYNSPQGCKYDRRCRFSHQQLQQPSTTVSPPNNTRGNQNSFDNNPYVSKRQNWPPLDAVVDINSLRTFYTFFISPEYKIQATVETISSIINKNKSNKHFMEIICSDILQLMHIQLGQTAKKSTHTLNVLKFAIEIIIDLDASNITQQKNWFNITMYLCKILNNYLSLPSITTKLFAHLNDNLYCNDTISYLLQIVKQILTLNPKLQIPLVFIENIDFNCHLSHGTSNEFLLKNFPSPKLLKSIFSACNFGQILPFDTNLVPIENKVTIAQKIRYLENNPWLVRRHAVSYYKLYPNEIPDWIVTKVRKKLGYTKRMYVTSKLKTANRSEKNVFTDQFRNTIHSTMPLHWIIISIRVFTDMYWNNIQNIIQNVITNDENILNINVDINNTNIWNLDVMQVIVDYIGDNNALIGLEKSKLFECYELRDIYEVVPCLKILNKNMDINAHNGFYKADDKLIAEWLNYFVKHRNYKCVPKTQNELVKCNFFANRAVSK